MIMRSAETSGAPMPQSTTLPRRRTARERWQPGAGRLLQHRRAGRDLWQTVLRSECPPEQSERLLRLKQLSDPVALEAATGKVAAKPSLS